MSDRTGYSRFAIRTRTRARRLARAVRGKQHYREGTFEVTCPKPAVMTARYERSAPETKAAGYPFSLVVGCRLIGAPKKRR